MNEQIDVKLRVADHWPVIYNWAHGGSVLAPELGRELRDVLAYLGFDLVERERVTSLNRVADSLRKQVLAAEAALHELQAKVEHYEVALIECAASDITDTSLDLAERAVEAVTQLRKDYVEAVKDA